MKKITIILLLICGFTYSQNLTIESGASLTIEKTGSATVGGNFSNSGTVTMNSDADDSQRFRMIDGRYNGLTKEPGQISGFLRMPSDITYVYTPIH